MDWFERLFGFSERGKESVYDNLTHQGGVIYSKANGKSYRCGRLEVASLASLRLRLEKLNTEKAPIILRELVGDVQQFHLLSENERSVFQAASQFNLLEMVAPSVTPSAGIAGYEHDHTQGPACAIACGAGTVYRNYFVDSGGQRGQVDGRQIDCLDELGEHWDNTEQGLWKMQNGYALATEGGLRKINELLTAATGREYDYLRSLIKVGIQWGTEVTIGSSSQLVSQVYCSALPVAYSPVPAEAWEAFARLVLESIYESTLLAGALNWHNTGVNRVFLTLVGGGAFGNRSEWIVESVVKILDQYRDCGLEIIFVSYGNKSEVVAEIVRRVRPPYDPATN